MSQKVLDVGQCNADHARITEFLTNEFDVEVTRAHSFDEAIKLAMDSPFDVILINRVVDADKSDGMAILHELKSQPSTAEVPIMIVSNFQEAQDMAVESGGVRGFGKAALDDPATRDTLGAFLVALPKRPNGDDR